MSKITNILLILVAVVAVGLTSCNKYEELERMDTENVYRDGELDGTIDDDLDGVNDGDDDDDESSATKGDKGNTTGGVNDGDEDEDESSAKTK